MPLPKSSQNKDYVCERIANALSEWTRRGGSQRSVADASGLSTSLVSLFFRGKVYPERDNFAKLLKAFDPRTRAELIEAYVLDGLPLGYQDLVSVKVRDETGKPNIVRELLTEDDEVERHFEWLRRMVKTKQDYRSWFLTNMRIFRRGEEGR